MSKNKSIFVLGLLIAVMPVLGFPPAWKTVFYIIAGICLVIISFHTYFKRKNQISTHS